MKKGKSVLTRRVLAGLLAWVLLGSVGYVQPAAAQTVEINTNEEYAQAGSDVKDSNGHIRPSGSITGNQVTIGTTNGGDVPLIGTGTGSGQQKNVYGAYINGSDGAVTNNHVYINSGQMEEVNGGYANGGKGDITGNSVTISGGTLSDSVNGGVNYGNIEGVATERNIIGNTVTITGGTIKKFVYGGRNSGPGKVKANKVYMEAGTISSNVYGGFAGNVSAIAEENSVIVTGGAIAGSVYGARNGMGTETKNNSVEVHGDNTTIGGSVYGGYGGGNKDSKVQSVAENKVTISGGKIETDVYGGYINEGTGAVLVKDNSVTVSGGTIGKSDGLVASGGRIYGGYSNSGATVTGNSVIVSGGTVGQGLVDGAVKAAVTGGYSKTGIVEGNSIDIGENSTIKGHVYGGDSDSGTVKGNRVNITGGTISDEVYGGNISSGNGTVEGNIVNINGGTIGQMQNDKYTGKVIGGYSEGAVTNNIVTVTGGTVNGNIVGGNSVSSSAQNNKVYISGGTVAQGVYGAYTAGSGDVKGNQVHISGGTISGDVYGGDTLHSNVTGNSVTISGAPKFGTGTVLYGGSSVNGTVSGNILNIHTKGLEVANVKGFDVYNFYLQNETQAGNTLLNLTGGSGNETTSLDGSTINVGMEGSAPALQVGDSVILVKNENGITADGVTYGKIKDGVSIEYEFTTELEGGTALVSRVTRAGISGDSKSPVETQLAAAAFINSGADLLAGSGISGAVTAAGDGNAEMFGAMSGGSMRYDTGSHADVHGYNMALGVGKAIANKAGQLTFGPFVEYGHGNYTSHLDSGVRGDGNTKYYGIGMLARQDNTSGVYYEGSLRYGRMDADYGSNDMAGALGKVHTHYDSSSAYYGAHLGIGKVTELNDSTKADVYAKLLYTHQSGDSVALQGAGAGEEYDFDAVDSTRARIGARVSKAYGSRSSGYVGVAYEYEFDGEARATVKGFSTPSPSIKGSSGLLELGYILQPQGANDPSINIGLQGWAGKKQGFTGNVNFVWTF